MASHQESAVEIEVMHYLDNPAKELSSLLAYPHVRAAFVKYNTSLRLLWLALPVKIIKY